MKTRFLKISPLLLSLVSASVIGVSVNAGASTKGDLDENYQYLCSAECMAIDYDEQDVYDFGPFSGTSTVSVKDAYANLLQSCRDAGRMRAVLVKSVRLGNQSFCGDGSRCDRMIQVTYAHALDPEVCGKIRVNPQGNSDNVVPPGALP